MLAAVFREVVQEMNCQQVDIKFTDNILCNIWMYLYFIDINAIMLCSHKKIVSCMVTLSCCQLVQSELLVQGVRDRLVRLPGTQLSENILVRLQLLLLQLHVLDHGFSMLLVLCYTVKIHWVIDTHQKICDRNSLACQSISMSLHDNLFNPGLKFFHLLTTWLS